MLYLNTRQFDHAADGQRIAHKRPSGQQPRLRWRAGRQLDPRDCHRGHLTHQCSGKFCAFGSDRAALVEGSSGVLGILLSSGSGSVGRRSCRIFFVVVLVVIAVVVSCIVARVCTGGSSSACSRAGSGGASSRRGVAGCVGGLSSGRIASLLLLIRPIWSLGESEAHTI